jgi:hypothetical protein
MSARLRTPVFIDSVIFEFPNPSASSLRAILRDECGVVCSTLDTEIPIGSNTFRWSGLNDLPYGIYTIEYALGNVEECQRMVKRV